MQLGIKLDEQEIFEKLKSNYGPMVNQKKAGVYYVRPTWYKSVKINLEPMDNKNTAVYISTAYTNRTQEALFFTTILIILFLPLIIALPLLVGLTILPHFVTKPLVQEVVSIISSTEAISDEDRVSN